MLTPREHAEKHGYRSPQYYRMKADQHWEMAGLARQDGDYADSDRHTKLAREYEELRREVANA